MKAHICIGGPLDGQHATSEDFYGHWSGVGIERDEGMYAHLKDDYAQFNNASSVRYRGDEPYGAVAWLYRPLVKPSISPRNR